MAVPVLGTTHRLVGALALALGARSAYRRVRRASLAGRVCVVTGGPRGLGLALAEELLAQGAKVAVCGRDADSNQRAREILESHGEQSKDTVLVSKCDVSKKAQVERFLALVEERLGPVEVLVNNAGVIAVGPLETQTLDDYKEELGIQFWGVVYPTLAVLPGMRRRGFGRVVNVTSVGGKVSVPWLLPYNASKFAAVGFSEGLRAELSGTGVQVTTVVPGLMRTGSYRAAFFKGDSEREASREYRLFTPLSATPLTTISARRAAKRIVAALRRGDAELTLTLHAKLAARAVGLAPGLTHDALGLVARLLPAVQGQSRRRGVELGLLDSSRLVAFGERAASELNQAALRPASDNGSAPGS